MSTLTLNFNQTKEACKRALKARLVPYVKGSPGLGKSAMAGEIANEWNLELIDIRLSATEPSDQTGLPGYTENGKATYKPFDLWPLENDPLPEQKKGWLILLDELPSAPLAVIASAYKMVLDKAVGQKNLHERVMIMCAGNLESDNAIVNDIGTAMNSRLIHLTLHVDPQDTVKYMASAGYDHRITGFLSFDPEAVHRFDPESADDTFPCSRTWEFVSKMIKDSSQLDDIHMALIAGAVGTPTAYDFDAFCAYYGELPSLNEILAAPSVVPVKNEPGVHWACVTQVAHYMTPENAAPMAEFLSRFGPDMQVIAWRQAVARDKALKKTPAYRTFITANADEYMN
jgi:hypothetical protein